MQKSNMRVLIVSQYFWPESFLINSIARSLSEQGVHVEIMTGKPNYPTGKIFNGYRSWGYQSENYQQIHVHRFPIITRGKSAARLALNYLSFVFSGIVLAPWKLRRKKFDVIFVFGMSPILQALPAIFLKRFKSSPVVLWVQDLWPESLTATGYVRNRFILKGVEKVVRFIYKHVDLILTQSQAFIERIQPLANNTPILYYPNAVDEAFINPQNDIALPDIPALEAPFSVMFAGNIGSAQAVDVIIEAATLLKPYPDIQFVVLGDGSKKGWMQKEAEKLGLSNLHLPGHFPVETMPGLMQQASTLLVTLADQDIFRYTIPSKIQSYLATGKPILACLNGEGARIIAEAGAGLTSEAENGKALADTILQLYHMPQKERDEIGTKGRVYYTRHFTHQQLISELIGHFESVCKTITPKQ